MDNENIVRSNTKLMTPGHNVIVDNDIEGNLERRSIMSVVRVRSGGAVV